MAVVLSDVLRPENGETGLYFALRNRQSGFSTDTFKMIHKYQDGTIKKFPSEDVLSLYGATGVPGLKGETGIDGTPGLTGAQGQTGAQGYTGLSGGGGGQGETGIQGQTGAQGIQGTQGIQGIQGNAGSQGQTGAQGIQGTQGIQGVQGIQGNVGSQGIQGATGVQGTQGIQGIQGIQGETGVQGIQGTQGTQGNEGIQGVTGLRGDVNNGFITVSSDVGGVLITPITTGAYYTLDDTTLEIASNFTLDVNGNGKVYCQAEGYYLVAYTVQVATDYASPDWVYARIKHNDVSVPTVNYYGSSFAEPGLTIDGRYLMNSRIIHLQVDDEITIEVGGTISVDIDSIYYYSLALNITPVRMIE